MGAHDQHARVPPALSDDYTNAKKENAARAVARDMGETVTDENDTKNKVTSAATPRV